MVKCYVFAVYFIVLDYLRHPYVGCPGGRHLDGNNRSGPEHVYKEWDLATEAERGG